MRRSKYNAVRTNGFASKHEAQRAAELAMLERAGAITDLEYQVRFELLPKFGRERAVSYVADFRYREQGTLVVEDAKGYRTPVYKLKRRMMAQIHGIEIREV